MKAFVIACIKGYAFLVSPLLGRNCRFHPTCSAYAVEAIEKRGVLKGFGLAVWRILRCNPWHKAPYDDPVPDSGEDKTQQDKKAV